MKVIYVGYNTPVLQAAREISEISQDECFSAREIAAITDLASEEVKNSLCSLSEKNLITGAGSGGTYLFSDDERWCIILQSLTIGREYEVLGIEADYYRLLNDHNDPVLFHPCIFYISDSTEPEFWICETGEDGERYCYPREWYRKGFFEDFHDGIQTIRQQFWDGINKYYSKGNVDWNSQKRDDNGKHPFSA